MSFQAGIVVSLAITMIGGVIFYFNEEDHEHTALTRLGLVILAIGFIALLGSMIFLRDWSR